MSNPDYSIWKGELDRLCLRKYCIDTNDMGFDDQELQRFWSRGDTVSELVAYLGTKFNLTLAEEVNWGKPFV